MEGGSPDPRRGPRLGCCVHKMPARGLAAGQGTRLPARRCCKDAMSDYEIIDKNLRTAMRFFGRATGSGDVVTLPGVEAIYSGLNYGVFNIAMLSDNPPRDRGLELRVAEAAHYFKTRVPRWSFWLCEDRLDTATRRRAREVLGDFGLRGISHPPGMIANTLLPTVQIGRAHV